MARSPRGLRETEDEARQTSAGRRGGAKRRPGALVERGPDGRTYALLSFRPQLEAKAAASEVVFLIDRSGSMQGTSIAEAKNALELCLRSLRTGCLFNIVGFGSTHEALFPESRPYGDDTHAAASRHVRSMEADMGGTEILPALELVLAPRPREGLPRQLFVLTDGEVSNTDAVIPFVRRHTAHTRVFTFGIGAGASHHLVKGLARAGEGEAEFIAPGERIEAKVLRQLSRALAPALSDVKVDWGGLAGTQARHEVPPVFSDVTYTNDRSWGSLLVSQGSGNTGTVSALTLAQSRMDIAVKANNTDDLDETTSWVLGNSPDNTIKISYWDDTVTSANTVSLGAHTTWGGIHILNPSGKVTIKAGHTLTLGHEPVDIDMSQATVGLALNCGVVLGAANVWDVWSSRPYRRRGGFRLGHPDQDRFRRADPRGPDLRGRARRGRAPH